MDNTKDRAKDLHSILFEQLERLNDDEACENKEYVEKELMRAKGICGITDKITELAKLQLETNKMYEENLINKDELPRLLC